MAGAQLKFIIFLVFQVQLFGFVYMPSGLVKGFALLWLFYSLFQAKRVVKSYNKPFVLLFVFCTINMIICFYNREQTPFEYIIGKEFTNILGLLVLFAIPAFKLKDYQVEQSLVVVAAIFILCYFVQYLIYPISLFTEEKNNLVEAMSTRFRMPGSCLIHLSFFYYLNRLIKKITLKNTIFFSISFLCLLILGFRLQIAVIILASGMMIIKYHGLTVKLFLYIFVSVVFLNIVLQSNIAQYKINQMIERNEKDNFNNEDYVRLKSWDYYVNIAPNNLVEKIFGIGLPNPNSLYGKTIQDLKSYHIIWADWGVIGLAWVLGIPAVLCMLWYVLLAFFKRISNKDDYYLQFWIISLFLFSLMTREFFREGCFAIQSTVLYIIAKKK